MAELCIKCDKECKKLKKFRKLPSKATNSMTEEQRNVMSVSEKTSKMHLMVFTSTISVTGITWPKEVLQSKLIEVKQDLATP